MRKVLLIAFSFFLLVNISANAKRKSIESIPFEMVGSYVVVKVRINDSSPLNLILDSGVRNTIITELMEGDKISLNYSDIKDLMGLGAGAHLGALMSNYNALKIGKLTIKPKTVYVLQEDVFNLSKHTGTKINGLIGVDFFQNYIVEIDYSAKRIRFFESESFINSKGYQMIPMTVESQKMFIQLSVLEADGTRKTVKMLIDTGAELNAWFQTFKSESVHIPKKVIRGTIGQGFNGEVTGKFGRLPQICFDGFCLTNAIVSFPDSACIAPIVANSDRDGTIGSQILSRFNIFIDYNQKHFYFKPNGNFKNSFKYNIAGIEITQIFTFLPQTEVWLVWENSPAALSGVQVGDQIIEINGQKAFQFTINELKAIFEKSSKSPLNLVLLRGSKEVTVKIDMTSKI